MAEASVLMRAFRAADQSYHTWRAGAYDPNMDDATGDQAPPFPIIDYSDHVVIGFTGDPLARSDADGFNLTGLGTSGTPVTFAVSPGVTTETAPGTDCRDFQSITYWVYITTPGTATNMKLFVTWAAFGSAASSDHSLQKSDDQIASGLSPQNTYIGDFTLPTTGGEPVGPFNVPVRGRRATLSVQTDTGDLQGYVVAMRLA